jgi:glyoxylate utilization-related uncharacterized protein
MHWGAMKRIRLEEAMPYEARGHIATAALRLSGNDETGAEKFWVGLSHFLPGGGTEYAGEDQPGEKVYIVIEGEVTVKSKTEEFILKPLDTLYIGPNEGRQITNKTNRPASMLVVVSY